jgi:hypothetical protein
MTTLHYHNADTVTEAAARIFTELEQLENSVFAEGAPIATQAQRERLAQLKDAAVAVEELIQFLNSDYRAFRAMAARFTLTDL